MSVVEIAAAAAVLAARGSTASGQDAVGYDCHSAVGHASGSKRDAPTADQAAATATTAATAGSADAAAAAAATTFAATR